MAQVSNEIGPERKRLPKVRHWAFQSVVDAWHQVRESDMQLLASSLAFATVVSIVPLMAVSLSVFHAFGGMDRILGDLERVLLQDLAGGAGIETRRALRGAIERIHSSALGVGGMAGLLFASTKLFHDMDAAVHRVWGITSSRPLWKKFFIYWITMFAGPLALAVAVGALGSIDVALLSAAPRRTIALAVAWFTLFAMCKWVPSRRVDLQPALWSSIAGAGVLWAVQAIYAYLTAEILNYNEIYGSLASIPIFFVWILILWQICLGVIAICASWQLRMDGAAAAVAAKNAAKNASSASAS